VRNGSGQIFADSRLGGYVFVSELARILAPPAEPRAYSYGNAVATMATGWIIGVLLLLLLAALTAQNLFAVPASVGEVGRLTTVLWFGAAMPLIALAVANREQRKLDQRLQIWRSAAHRWQRLYYCARDDIVFLPFSEDPVVRPDKLNDLISASSSEPSR